METLLMALTSGLQQIPVVDEPGLTIQEFNKSEARKYFDSDIFGNVWGVALVNSDYGRFLFAVDPFCHRLIYGRQGLKGVKAVGADELVRPWDITTHGNHIYVTDRGLGVVAEFEIYRYYTQFGPITLIRFVRYMTATAGGVTLKLSPMGIAYSNKGYLYVANVEAQWGSVAKFDAVSGAFLGEYRGTDGPFNADKIRHPIDIAVGKTIVDGSVVNTDTIYVLEASRRSVVMYEDKEMLAPVFIKRVKLDPVVRPYTIETDACGQVYITTDDEQILVYDAGMENRLEVYSGFTDIRDIYIYGNELMISERWTDDDGISLYRITDGCAGDTCMLVVRIADPRDRQIIRANSLPIKGEAFCKSHPDPGYGYVKYWALYIAPGWDIVGTFAFLAGAPGGTEGVDTLCWLVADTFPAGQYTLPLEGHFQRGIGKGR